ncbi:MAG TPA: hypothetical protein VFV38_08885 [Ktedonobacteraceae bacterium]|nr:hypothetical protein [Ktedonobacteraceae bacterium]
MVAGRHTGTPLPRTTVVILLGASQWPHDSTFLASDAFKEAAEKIEAYFVESFQVPQENILSLFNTDFNAIQICSEIYSRLERLKRDVTDVVVYYVGHARRTIRHSQLYLAIQETQRRDPEGTSLKVENLTRAVCRAAPHLRRYYIFDCCFAASAIPDLQGVDEVVLAEGTLEDVESETQEGGFVALCSSNMSEPSVILPGHTNTYFTEALLQVLEQGDQSKESALSFNSLCRAINGQLTALRKRYTSSSQAEKPPFAVIFAGNLANIPFFPNRACSLSTQGEVKTAAPKNKVNAEVEGISLGIQPKNSSSSNEPQQTTSNAQFSFIKIITHSVRLMVCGIVFILYWLTVGYTTPKIFPGEILRISGSTYVRMLFVGNNTKIQRLKVVIILLILVIDWFLVGTLLSGIPNSNVFAQSYTTVSWVVGIVLLFVLFGLAAWFSYLSHKKPPWPYINVVNFRKILEVTLVNSLLALASQLQPFGAVFLYFPIAVSIVSLPLFFYGMFRLEDTSYAEEVLAKRKDEQERLEQESEAYFQARKRKGEDHPS